LNCYKNEEFAYNSTTSQISNAIANQCLYEKTDQTLALRSCKDSNSNSNPNSNSTGDEADLWIYDEKKKTLTNSHSSRCMGSDAGPTPGPGPAPGGKWEAVVTAVVNGEELYSKAADARLWQPLVGAAFIGTGVHFAQFDDFSVVQF
jgi:hypothetical protein